MIPLREAARSEGVQSLIQAYLERSEVLGFTLGVHWNFLVWSREEYGSELNVNEILEAKIRPLKWSEACRAEKLPDDLSPIYVKVHLHYAHWFVGDEVLSRYGPVISSGYLLVYQPGLPFEALSGRTRHRPIRPGISVGNLRSGKTGTIGGFVRKTSTSDVYLTGCNHVLHASGSNEVSQQGPDDGGGPREKIGVVEHVVPLDPPAGFSWGSSYNAVDIAVARIDAGITIDRSIRGLGIINSIVPLPQISIDDEVVFVGKESGQQRARVSEFVAAKKVRIDGTDYLFGDIFLIEARRPIYVGGLARPGDSGAWVAHTGGGTCGLYGVLFAGDRRSHALCCFAENVFQALHRETQEEFVVY